MSLLKDPGGGQGFLLFVAAEVSAFWKHSCLFLKECLYHLSYLGCAVGVCLQCNCGDMEPRYTWQSHRHSQCYEKNCCYLTLLPWLFKY